jgi:hypothetical protein
VTEIELEEDDSDDSCWSKKTPDSITSTRESEDFDTLQMVMFQEPGVALSEAAVHYRFPSEHLKMISSKFMEILASQTLIHDRGERSGCDYIIIDDCDEEAILHLLNVLHLRNRQSPRTLRLRILTKLAVLIS